jgi:hypothetical protein
MTTNHVNPELSTGMAANPIPPSDVEKQAIAGLRLDERYEDVAVSQRAAALKENAKLTVDDGIKTFSDEVITRLIRTSGTKPS